MSPSAALIFTSLLLAMLGSSPAVVSMVVQIDQRQPAWPVSTAVLICSTFHVQGALALSQLIHPS